MQENQVIPMKEIEEKKAEVTSLAERMASVTVTNEDELKAVADHIATVKRIQKGVTEVRDKYIQPAKDIIAHAKATFDPIINNASEVERLLKDKAQTFMVAEQKRKREAEAKEIKKVESGYQKPETAARKISEQPEAKKSADATDSKLSMKMVKDFRITDETKIPDEYYKPRELDMQKIKKVALAGVAIPGVEVFEKPQMSSRLK